MSLDLFAFLNDCTSTECDHLPVGQRQFIGEWLICHKCGKKLRPKNMTLDVPITDHCSLITGGTK